MFIFAITAMAFMAEPITFVRAPLGLQPRLLQVGTVPGFAPPPLAAPPAVLNVTINPPAPGASYVVTCVYSNPGPGWVGTVPAGVMSPPNYLWGGGRIGVMPYASTQFTSAPFTADQLFARIIFLPPVGGADYGGGLIRVNTDNPYTAGPAPLSPGQVTAGYSFTVGP